VVGDTAVLGGMSPDVAQLTTARADTFISSDGRPTPTFRDQLRCISNARNALTVALFYAQNITIIAVALWWHHPVGYVITFLLMGRAHAQCTSLMHEAAHRLLFTNKALNDFVGSWLLGFVSFTSTAAYRRVHMAHHRQEFGPDEPDIPLYANYPVARASLRRKLVRDATGQTAVKLFRQQFAALRSPVARVRNTQFKILAVHIALIVVSTFIAGPFVWVVFWLLPYMTVWRVINRLRSIAEHGGMNAGADRRTSTHSVRQSLLARTFLVPYGIGFHLAHHVDAGIPFRSLPDYHRRLVATGYAHLEYPTYRSLWKALSEVAPTTA
jgi:fatty acid desaturase